MQAYMEAPPRAICDSIAPYKEDMRQAHANRAQVKRLMREGFGIVPLMVTANPKVSLQAKALYSYVASRAETSEYVDISYDNILHDLHTTRRTFKKLCRELLDAGIMRAYVRRDAIAVGERDLPYGIVRFWIPRNEIPADRRNGGALYVL